MVSWRTLNIHETFLTNKGFFIVEKYIYEKNSHYKSNGSFNNYSLKGSLENQTAGLLRRSIH